MSDETYSVRVLTDDRMVLLMFDVETPTVYLRVAEKAP
jgi:hypothetical protein